MGADDLLRRRGLWPAGLRALLVGATANPRRQVRDDTRHDPGRREGEAREAEAEREEMTTDHLTVLLEMRHEAHELATIICVESPAPYLAQVAALDTAIAACTLVQRLAQVELHGDIGRGFTAEARALFQQEPTI